MAIQATFLNRIVLITGAVMDGVTLVTTPKPVAGMAVIVAHQPVLRAPNLFAAISVMNAKILKRVKTTEAATQHPKPRL